MITSAREADSVYVYGYSITLSAPTELDLLDMQDELSCIGYKAKSEISKSVITGFNSAGEYERTTITSYQLLMGK